MENFYIPAYTVTNEDWRWAREITRDATSVLTVAGSGDQALTYRLTGAKTVDTYDITKCAGILQEIKTAAIPIMSRLEYYQLLRELRCCTNALNLASMERVIPRMCPQTIDLMRDKIGAIAFNRGSRVDAFPENLFTDDEYKRLQKIITGSFKFLNCNITNLRHNTTQQYDLIDISNIFDYGYERPVQIKILTQLTQCLTPQGRIISMPQSNNFSYDKFKIELENGNVLVHENSVYKTCFDRMNIFQRTR